MTLNQRIELMLCAEESYIQQGIRDGILRDFADLEAKLAAANIGADQHAKLLAYETTMRREACTKADTLRTQNTALLVALKYHMAQTRPIQQSIDAIALAEGKDV